MIKQCFAIKKPSMMLIKGRESGNIDCDILYRSIPVTIWCKRLEEEQTVGLARQEANLTTADETATYCQGCYVVALKYLLHNPEDPDRGLNAFGAVLDYILT
jgi:hypothetical protein